MSSKNHFDTDSKEETTMDFTDSTWSPKLGIGFRATVLSSFSHNLGPTYKRCINQGNLHFFVERWRGLVFRVIRCKFMSTLQHNQRDIFNYQLPVWRGKWDPIWILIRLMSNDILILIPWIISSLVPSSSWSKA